MQPKRNIKGFTILELLVILAIVGIVSALGFPKFDEWSMDRKVRAQAEKVATLVSVASTQVERGSYPYVRIEFEGAKFITVKGISPETLSDKLNSGNPPECTTADMNDSELITSYTLDDDVKVFHLKKSAAICFSKGGKYFNQVQSASTQGNVKLDNKARLTNNVIVLCHNRLTTCNAVTNSFLPIKTATVRGNFPAYLVSYSRFGMVNKYKWSYSESDWTNQ